MRSIDLYSATSGALIAELTEFGGRVSRREQEMKTVVVALIAGIVGCACVRPVSAADAITYKETVLHSFCSQQNCADGYFPAAGVIDSKGTLYGTTVQGGNAGCNCGIVFSFDLKTGKEKTIYTFCSQQNCADGASPYTGLIDVKGTLYGTTQGGGGTGCSGHGCGTVFSINPKTGVEKVVYSFAGGSDGQAPGGLIEMSGLLFGTTVLGGGTGCDNTGCGTVFSVEPSTGVEKVLYSFCNQPKCADGASPVVGQSLIYVNGMLYGTTGGGGTGCSGSGCGTAFSVNPDTGAEMVLYSFCSQQNCADGANPYSGLVDMDGTMYGTTSSGGTACNELCGTVYSLNPNTGEEAVLHSFCSERNCTDGASPLSGLIDLNGALYGTTELGGVPQGCDGSGCGTAYSINPTMGTETVLYTFCSQQNCTDGLAPVANLLNVKGTLYGTTGGGGAEGSGTVFSLKK